MEHSNLQDAFLRGTNLRGANLQHSNLRGSSLQGTNLRGAYLPKIVKVENLFTKILAAVESYGELEMGNWHGCKTTHCIAGWVTTLAGEAGRVAEELIGTPWAASIIIRDSCPYLKGKNPNFYIMNDRGMAFIKECAAKEAEM